MQAYIIVAHGILICKNGKRKIEFMNWIKYTGLNKDFLTT